MHLGAGRMKKEDNIDYAVGNRTTKKNVRMPRRNRARK